MTTSEVANKITAQAASLLEKATEFRLFCHAICIAGYLEVALFFTTGYPLLAVSWKTIESITPGTALLGVVGYFALMGYILRVVYVSFFSMLRAIARSSLFSSGRARWYEKDGYVSENNVLTKTYASKDYEPLRPLDEHKKQCKEDRRETREFAYLYFSALGLSVLNYCIVPGGFLTTGYTQLSGLVSNWVVIGALLLPLPLLWFDASDDDDRDRHLYHPPLAREIAEERKLRGTTGY